MPNDNNNIVFTNLKKTYYNNVSKTYKTALHIPGKVEIRKGQVTTILGYSASGKSTLLNQIALLDEPDLFSKKDKKNKEHKPTVIEVCYKGTLRNISDLEEKDIVDIRRNHFGFIFQSGHLLTHFKTGQNVAVPLYLNEHSSEVIKSRIHDLLNKAFPPNIATNYNKSEVSHAPDEKPSTIEELVEQDPRTLSGGQYLRAAVLRGISHNPRILFADEPTGNLDPATGKSIMKLITDGWMCQEDRDEKSLIMVTHDYSHAYNYSDRILVLSDGRLVMDIELHKCEPKRIFTGKSFPKVIDGKNPQEVKEVEFGASMELLEKVEQISGKKDTSKKDDKKLIGKSSFNNTNQHKSPILFNFSLKYARRELCYYWPFSLMNAVTIFILISSVLIIGGIFCGADRLLDAKIDRDPMLKRLYFFATAGSSGGKRTSSKVTTDHIGKIMSLEDKSGNLRFQEPDVNDDGSLSWPEGDIIDKALPFYEHDIRFYKSDGNTTTLGPYFRGRTVHPEVPLIKCLKFTAEGVKGSDIFEGAFTGLDFKGKEKDFPFGIIVSSRTLNKLGYTDQDNYPKEIDISYRNCRKVKLQIMGVATNIPIPYDFLITDDYYAAFVEGCWNSESFYNTAYLGPFTEETAENLKNNFDKYIDDSMKEIDKLLPLKIVQRKAIEKYWLSFSIGSMKESELMTQAEFHNKLYIGLTFQSRPDGIELPDKFEFPDSICKAGVSKDLKEYINNDMLDEALLLGVYFHDIENMIDAAELFESEINLTFESSNIKFIKHILFVKNLGLGLFLIISFIVGLTVLCNIFLSFYQNIKGKVAEIGILRAIGASKGLVYRFYLLESVFLWALAFLIGISASYPFGLILGSAIGRSIKMDKCETIFYMQWQLILITAVITLSICVLGAFLAVARTIKKITPAEAVRYQGN